MKRDYGIDALRIMSMFLICVLHVNGQGLAMAHVYGKEGTYYATLLLEAAAYCAVDVYGLISGYVGIGSRHRFSRLIELWLTVFWYSALGSLLAVKVFGYPVSTDTIYKALFPTMWKTYWYFSAYVGVFFLAPYLNRMVMVLERKELKRLTLMLFALCTFGTMIPRVAQTGSDWLGLGAGYSFVWLMILYIMGACLRRLRDMGPSEEMNRNKPDLLHRRRGFYLLVYTVSVLFSWIFKITVDNHFSTADPVPSYGRMFMSYAAPTTLACALCLLMLFCSLRIPKPVRAVIRFLSPLAFSVYLVQVQPFVWDYVLKGRFAAICQMNPVRAFFAVLGGAVVLYLICCAADLLRYLFFRLLSVRKKLDALSARCLR